MSAPRSTKGKRLIFEEAFTMRSLEAAQDMAESMRAQFQRPRYLVRLTIRRAKREYIATLYRIAKA